MILSYKELKIKKENITFKKSKQYSKDFTFIPIQYDKKDILIQTPSCFIPFGLNQFSKISKKKYLDVTFQEKNSDFIHDCLSVFFEKVQGKYNTTDYYVEEFLKSNQYSKQYFID